MRGFCGAYDMRGGEVELSALRRMSGMRAGVCACLNGPFGIMFKGEQDLLSRAIQPLSRSYGNDSYTVALISDSQSRAEQTELAAAMLEGYAEEGESYLCGAQAECAAAIYDARRAELRLFAGNGGKKAIYYSVCDGVLYFSTSLLDVSRGLGGCVRVSAEGLREHIGGDCVEFPRGLFCDIERLGESELAVCTRLGVERCSVRAVRCSYPELEYAGPRRSFEGEEAELGRCLSEALFAFGYPQFDCYMPSLMGAMERCRRACAGGLRVADPYARTFLRYSAHRAEALGDYFDVSVAAEASGREISGRCARRMEARLNKILEAQVKRGNHSLFRALGTEDPLEICDHKEIQRRIRSKGMLCQCIGWFDCICVLTV